MFTLSLSNLIGWCVVIVLVPICVYFTNDIIHGKRGLIAQIKLRDELTELNVELEEQQVEIQKIKTKLSQLSVDNLDLDLLDELARKKLVFIHHEEVIIH